MAELTFQNTGTTINLEDGSTLTDPCEEAGVHFACGQGYCGTCIVQVISGEENLSPPTQKELDFLGDDGVKKERMACQCRILKGQVKIKI
jgi:ferredoxin